MSVIGHLVLIVLYGAWEVLVSLVSMVRTRRIRLEDEDEQEQPLLMAESGDLQSCWLGTDMLPVSSYVERAVTVVEEKSQS